MLGAAIKKDFQLLVRDRPALGSLFVLPIIFIAAFGSMFGSKGGGKREPRTIPVYHEPDDQGAAKLVGVINLTGLFRTETQKSADEVRKAVAEERFLAGLIIPRDFDPRAGKLAELVIDEGASPMVRGPIEGALGGILGSAHFGTPARVLEARTPPGIQKPMRGVSGFQVTVPGNAVLFGFFLALTVALSFVEERRTGTWRRLLAAPVSRPTLLLAKLVPYSLVGLIQFLFLFGIGILVFDMKVGGSMVALIVMTVAVVICATALGLLIASFAGTEKQVGGIGSIVILVMGLLGGAMMPRMIMPETMQKIGLMVPHGWALEGYYDILIREGTTLLDVWKEIAVVMGFATVFATVGALKFRFER